MAESVVYLNLDKEAAFIAEVPGCSLEQADTFVDLEDDYYDSIGLNVYELDVTHEELRSDVVVDDEDIIKYVCGRTDKISRDLCERMLEAEYKYFVENGIAEEG